MGKRLVCLLLFIGLGAGLWARPRGDTEVRSVDDPEGFSETVDIEGKKSGKYNFFIEAHDRGGNTSIAGPYNVYIDPESDLPVAMITNPRQNMRIPGNLNIVGTCVDDDAVDHVELVFNDDPETTVRAEGADFWSYYLDTTGMDDGFYSITAYGVDSNGLKGKPHRTGWHLDRSKPVTEVESHSLGSMASGRITLRGSVKDGNGVESLAYAGREGEFNYLKLNFDKRGDNARFELPLDTRQFEDGPAIIWFKARDRQGSEGTYTYLIFVDNTGPEVSIVYPEDAEQPVNGVFHAAGFVKDAVGLKSLTWTLGNESGEFDLIIGNPWWVKEFDIRNQKAKSLDLEIKATDISGNVSVAHRRLSIDQDADLPVLAITSPEPGAVFTGRTLGVSGRAWDDDQVAALLYSIDGGDAVEVPCPGGPFRFLIKDLNPGSRRLEFWARDIYGVEGQRTIIPSVVLAGDSPALRIAGILSGRSRNEGGFYSGMELNSENAVSFNVELRSDSPLKSVSYRYGRGEAKTITLSSRSGGEAVQELPLSADVDFGLVPVHFEVQDIYGRTSVLDDYVYITDLSRPRGESRGEAFPVFHSSQGTLRIDSLDEIPWRSGMVLEIPRGSKKPITLQAVLESSQAVEQALVSLGSVQGIKAALRRQGNTSNYLISVNLPQDLPAERFPFTVEVRTKTNETLKVSDEFIITRPLEGRLVNDAEGLTWVNPAIQNGSILLKPGASLIGLYTGRALVSASTLNLPDGFSLLVDPYGRVILSAGSGGSYGPLNLSLTDAGERTFDAGPFSFIVCGTGPSLELEDETDGSWVRDELPLRLTAADDLGLASLEYSFDFGETWQNLALAGELDGRRTSLEKTLDLASFDDGMIQVSIRVINLAGFAKQLDLTVYKDTAAPRAVLVTPVSGEKVNGIIRLGILVEDGGKLARVSYERPDPAQADMSSQANLSGRPDLPVRPDLPAQEVRLSSSVSVEPAPFIDLLVGTDAMPLFENMVFRFEDASGNVSVLDHWPFVIDAGTDLPVAEVNLPNENDVITTDFVVSGIMYDDDKIARVWYAIDNNPEEALDAVYNPTMVDIDSIDAFAAAGRQFLDSENAYTIEIPLSSLSDNEHTVAVSAEDIYGVRCEPVVRAFRVSLEEPRAEMLSPDLKEISKGVIKLSGTAQDKNGVQKIQVSLDNGNTFNDAEGTEDWSYTFNSQILRDGTHVVFIRVWDNYDISGLYSSLVNIDNTPPALVLESPADGMSTVGPVFISGQAMDSVGLESITINVRSMAGRPLSPDLAEIHLEPEAVIANRLDLGILPDGLYNIDVWAQDRAKNVTRLSRNVQLAKDQRNFVENLYPLNGEHVRGSFNLYGYAGGTDRADMVTLSINGSDAETAALTAAGYYRFAIDGTMLAEGRNVLVVRGDFGGRELVLSPERIIEYENSGAWITIDSLVMGDFVFERPWLSGRAGYVLDEADRALMDDKKSPREARVPAQAKALSFVDISFDNGRTFTAAQKGRDGADWRYRLETQDMTEGMHYLIVRAVMLNGETAVTRTLVQIDKTLPSIRLISPENGGRYNQHMEFSALVSDDVELGEVSYTLRSGDKAAYEVPGFIQGLYFDMTIPPFIKQAFNGAPDVFSGGATYMDMGVGLSFFDDNVKLQMQYGFMSQKIFESLGKEGLMRYGGNVLGLKLLANIFTLPFSSLWGPDFTWLSGSIALGANFSLFSAAQSGTATWMSAIISQIEFPRVTIPRRKMFRTFSMFTELQLWFVPTDVKASDAGVATVMPHVVIGLRANVF